MNLPKTILILFGTAIAFRQVIIFFKQRKANIEKERLMNSVEARPNLDPYKVLGIEESSSQKQIEKAYKTKLTNNKNLKLRSRRMILSQRRQQLEVEEAFMKLSDQVHRPDL